MKLRWPTSPLLRALLLMSTICIGLFAVRVFNRDNYYLWFLNWNLILAWAPLLIASVLANYIKHNPWISGKGIALSVVWLLFLPNSFYIISDFIHLQNSPKDSLLYDSAMIFTFALTGLLLGITGLYAMHRLLLTRLRATSAWMAMGAVMGLCSFAVYLGRYLRWNTWDVIFNPAGVIFDVSDRFINPGNYERTFSTTLLFFVLILGVYVAFWQLVAKPSKAKKH